MSPGNFVSSHGEKTLIAPSNYYYYYCCVSSKRAAAVGRASQQKTLANPKQDELECQAFLLLAQGESVAASHSTLFFFLSYFSMRSLPNKSRNALKKHLLITRSAHGENSEFSSRAILQGFRAHFNQFETCWPPPHHCVRPNAHLEVFFFKAS